MIQSSFQVPSGFYWGTATSSQQVEGNNTNNNWWQWENEPGRIKQGHKAGLACDWWGGRWREDFDRAADSYQNAHRLSIEWSRVQPKPDIWDEQAFDHYRQMLSGLRQRGITPFVTLHHFSDPLWFMEMGGWENTDAPQIFAKYVTKTIESLKEYTSLWCTINEPNVYTSFAYVVGAFPPGKHDINAAFRVMTNMIRAHALAYHIIHNLQPESRVGIAIHHIDFHPLRSWFPLDTLVTNIYAGAINNAFTNTLVDGTLRFVVMRASIPEARGTQDYLGLNYYTREYVRFNPAKAGELFGERTFARNADLSDGGFTANEPDGFYNAIHWATRYGLPIIIAENGIECADDHIRPRYIIQHIHQMMRSMQEGIPIQGYFHWSLVDNFEWERGWTQRFGLWELDNITQERRKRKSADLFTAICKNGTLTHEMVSQFAPEVFNLLK
ncbi:MAG: family 1 glycosylhydrolase [Chloroflexota bacterium]